MPQFSLKFPDEHSVQDAENPFKFHPSELEVIYKYEHEAKGWMIKGEDTLYLSTIVIAMELRDRIDNPYCDWATLAIYLEQLRVMQMTMTHITEQQWEIAELDENGYRHPETT